MLAFRRFRRGILHQKVDKVILGRYFDPDDTAFRPRLNAVIDGIFHQRLQCQGGGITCCPSPG